MSRLFGLPVGTLAAALLGILAVGLLALGVLALRNRAFFRLAVRNVGRRPGRSALIVSGLMLGTAIIAAALATGDTMGNTIRQAAITSLGQTDEVVSARGVQASASSAAGAAAAEATGVRWFPLSYLAPIERRARASGLVDAVAPAIVEPVAVQNTSTRQSEPRVTLFASDPRRLAGFGTIRDVAGGTVTLADLGQGEVFLNAKAADKLDAAPGQRLVVFAGGSSAPMRVRAIVRFDGTLTDQAALLLPLAPAQRLLGEPGRIREVLVSNRGGDVSGARLSDRVVRALRPVLAPRGLEAATTKKDALALADQLGSAFMAFFTMFGSFSVAAGILLIFLIFVMLASERRRELGIARAVGTRRRHLVLMFLFEGVSYSLIAAAVGALGGIAIAYGMVLVMANAFGTTSDLAITYSVNPRSVVVAYGIGVLLTFVVVGFSAWRVSRMNIVTAIRNLPEPPPAERDRRRWIPGTIGVLAGLFVAYQGVSSSAAVPFALGVSVALVSAVPLARLAGLSDRLAHTVAGVALVLWNVLPTNRWVLGNPKTDFSIFLVGGLAIVVGATWVMMYNADALLGVVAWSLRRFRGLAPVLKMSMAYPLRSVFRTGVTLAMFTLVVFTLVVGSIVTTSYVNAANDLGAFGGGFDVRATVAPSAPIPDLRAALASARGLDPAAFRVVAAESTLPVRANQLGSRPEDYVAHGLDAAFLAHTTYGLAARARGYPSAAAVWRALRTTPGLAVVDAFVVPRRSTFVGQVPPKFQLHGFYLEDRAFAPVTVVLRDPQTGRHVRLKVIGVLSEKAPQDMLGVFASQATLRRAFGDRVQPTTYLFALRKGTDAKAVAKALESTFLAHGLQADALSKLLHDAVSASVTFDRLIMGFMGLGLIVGVAALGVISARSVVERRQQIGVLRAIGFRRRMVQASFLLESSFIALTSIALGTVLGLAVGLNVVLDARRAPSWAGMSFDVPWPTLAVIFLVVYAVALATTYAPALRASRVYPAEALRYQ
jgi:putative ABC transport system permease protein